MPPRKYEPFSLEDKGVVNAALELTRLAHRRTEALKEYVGKDVVGLEMALHRLDQAAFNLATVHGDCARMLEEVEKAAQTEPEPPMTESTEDEDDVS